jgi:hypothetical protein
MVLKKIRRKAILAGLMLILVGAALAICSRPVFTFARDEYRQVPKSQVIIDYSFEIHESQDKLVQVQMIIGQNLSILATGDGNFNFSIANFTDPTQAIQPDQPDVTYLSLEDTNFVNTTWRPTVRAAQPGSYYLIFLARNASSDSPVHIVANVTKAWTEVQTYGVPYQAALIDSNFAYVGLGTAVFGAIVSAFFYPRRRLRKLS